MAGSGRRFGGEHLVLAAAIAIAIGLAAAFRGFVLDDAFITFRYARNLAAGLGPTWDAEAPRAEGSTSFLWLAIMALPHLAGVDALLFAKIAGVACLAGSAAGAAVIAHQLTADRDEGARRRAAAAAAAIVAATPFLHISALSGMETSLAACATTAFFAAQIAFARAPSPGIAAAIAGLALAMGLTRPEGNLVAGVGIAALIFTAPLPARRALVTRAAALYVVPGALFFAWRFRYYGHAFPLSFYVKVADPWGFAGAGQVASFVAMIAVHLGVPLSFAAAAAAGDGALRRLLLPPVAAAAALVAFLTRAAPIMGEYHRFFVPVVPLFAALAAVGLAAVEGAFAGSPARLPRILIRYGAVAMVALGLVARVRPLIESTRGYADSLRAAHVMLGRRLARIHEGGGGRRPLLAIADAGAVPYFSGWRAIDTFGLNDAHIALAHDHAPAYVLDQHPDAIILISGGARGYAPAIPWEKDLHDAALARGFAEVATVTFTPGHYYLTVLANPGGPIAADLRALPPPAP